MEVLLEVTISLLVPKRWGDASFNDFLQQAFEATSKYHAVALTKRHE